MAEFAFGGIESLPSWSRFVAVSVRMVPDADTQDQGLFNYKANCQSSFYSVFSCIYLIKSGNFTNFLIKIYKE